MRISIRCLLVFSSISVSVVCVCLCLSLSNDLLNSLSTTVFNAFLSLCLILSLIIVYLLLYNTKMSNLLPTPSFITSRQCSIFCVFIAGEFDRQTDRQRYYYIDIYSLAVFCTQYRICSTALYCNDSNV